MVKVRREGRRDEKGKREKESAALDEWSGFSDGQDVKTRGGPPFAVMLFGPVSLGCGEGARKPETRARTTWKT